MKLLRVIKSVRKLLFINKLRAVLSLIGIAIGIAAVIIVSAIGNGARAKVSSQIEAMGSNLITINSGKVKEVTGRKRQTTKVTTLKEKDAEAILEQCNTVKLVAPTQDQTLRVKFENSMTSGRIIGTVPAYPLVRNYQVATGRFFTIDDNKHSRRVAVIGWKIVENLFHDNNPVGQIIRINNIPFEIIGTLKPKGASYDGANEDEVIFIPLRTGLKRLFARRSSGGLPNVNFIKNIYVQVTSQKVMKETEHEIRTILRERHRLNIRNTEHPDLIVKEDDFTIQNIYTALKAANETNSSFTFLITGVAALSLIIGGVGILAIMLLSVKERTSEIGLQMAVGAKPRYILIQFLLEAIILSTLGGITGIVTGFFGSYILSAFSGLATLVSLQSVIISVLISISLGVFFGAAPARKASLIQPVIALNK